MDKSIIELKNVSFKYEKYTDREAIDVLKNINLKINKGQYVAIIGHNGSGKSTLAKLLNGLELPSIGDVFVDGLNTKDEENIYEIRKKCGLVFQNPDNQIVATIVEEDVAFGAENIGIELPELRNRVDEALKVVDMFEYKNRSPHTLSGGQKQRIAIAGVIAMNSDYIVLDEPTAMLDPLGRKEIVNTLDKLNKNNKKTVIFVTHFMEEVIRADRVLVMNDGVIVMDGTPKEIFTQVEKVKKLGLDVPQVTELAFLLRKDGFKINEGILSIDELVDTL